MLPTISLYNNCICIINLNMEKTIVSSCFLILFFPLSINSKFKSWSCLVMVRVLFKQPFTCIVSGPTSSGKSTFAVKFIKNIKNQCTPPYFHSIIWCLSETNAAPLELKGLVSFYKGIPDFNNESLEPKLIILDDLMRDAYSPQVSDLFSKLSHHRNLSILLVTQNLFHQARGARDISLNSKYIVVYKNPRDKNQVAHLARQVYPENWRGLHKAFLDATKQPHGYLLLDLCQDTPDLLRFRTNIFDEHPLVYAPIDDNDDEDDDDDEEQNETFENP
jgi:hypothetical protein